MRRIFGYTWRYPWRAVATLVLAAVCTLLVLVLPALSKEFTDEVIPKGQTERIVPLALVGFQQN